MEKSEIVNTLSEVSWYIETIVGSSNLEEHHKDMFRAIDYAIEIINKN
jgi:ribosome-associated translation inhibitor RaiA